MIKLGGGKEFEKISVPINICIKDFAAHATTLRSQLQHTQGTLPNNFFDSIKVRDIP